MPFARKLTVPAAGAPFAASRRRGPLSTTRHLNDILAGMQFKLSPCQIGDFTINVPVVLAPMAGYTDLPYRLICRRLGAGYCTTEMMLDRMVLLAGRKLQVRMMALSGEDHPVGGQLIGNDPLEMARAAEALAKNGFDVIDLNFACPVRKALSRKRGGYMLTQPRLCAEIVKAVVAAAGRPVTLKIRQRFKNDHDSAAFFEIADSAFAAGIAALCVHARSVEAKYTGRADWDFLASARQRYPDKTLIGSGDVLTPKLALDMLQKTGMSAVAVARGCLGNPWFFTQVQDLAEGREPYRPSVAEQRELILNHFIDAVALYGEEKGPGIMRKFGIKYARLHPTPKDVRVAFVAVKNERQWREVLEAYYSNETE